MAGPCAQHGTSAKVLVLTAKDLTREEHGRLEGDVQRILQKDSSTRDSMLREVGNALARCMKRAHAGGAA